MKTENIITGDEITLNIRENATFYEIMQETVRQTALTWKQQTNNGKKLRPVKRLHDIRILEKYAKKYGLQRELREYDII